jgi:hypothetical protein
MKEAAWEQSLASNSVDMPRHLHLRSFPFFSLIGVVSSVRDQNCVNGF